VGSSVGLGDCVGSCVLRCVAVRDGIGELGVAVSLGIARKPDTGVSALGIGEKVVGSSVGLGDCVGSCVLRCVAVRDGIGEVGVAVSLLWMMAVS
jgi:hypothetical protein